MAWEGCLSVRGLRGLVPRYTRIRYGGTLPDGSRLEREVDGWHARVVQHELDHLDGILYPQRMGDLKDRSEEHTSELQSLMRISYAVFCLKKKKNTKTTQQTHQAHPRTTT